VGLLETHRGKISLHSAKAGYDYPTIRLPHTLSALAGLPTKIYQAVHEGALAFLVVISPTAKALESPKSSVLIWRRSRIRIPSRPSFFLQSDTKIMADDEHDGDEEDPLSDIAMRRGIVKSYLQIQQRLQAPKKIMSWKLSLPRGGSKGKKTTNSVRRAAIRAKRLRSQVP